MREADFCAIDRPVAGTFDNGEDVMVLWIENDALDGGLACASVFASLF